MIIYVIDLQNGNLELIKIKRFDGISIYYTGRRYQQTELSDLTQRTFFFKYRLKIDYYVRKSDM